jgi:hypothetical protein
MARERAIGLDNLRTVPKAQLTEAITELGPKRIDELATIPDADLEFVEAGSGGKLSIEVLVEGEDARRLTRIATERGQRPGEVVAELLRSA